MASTTQSTQATPSFIAGYLFKVVIASLVFQAIWLLAAGRWNWFWPWLYTGLFVLYDIGTVVFVDPAVLAERSENQKDAKAWDRPYVIFAAALLPMIAGIVAGLDLRFGWLPEVSPIVQWIAAGLVALGLGIVLWAMWANAYFSAVVRIQTERGHTVATGGPYRIVRHPGYVGAILFTVAMPLMFGSVWALIPAVLAAILYVIRTKREDETLQAELPGYREYTQQTRYRLIPGVW